MGKCGACEVYEMHIDRFIAEKNQLAQRIEELETECEARGMLLADLMAESDKSYLQEAEALLDEAVQRLESESMLGILDFRDKVEAHKDKRGEAGG